MRGHKNNRVTRKTHTQEQVEANREKRREEERATAGKKKRQDAPSLSPSQRPGNTLPSSAACLWVKRPLPLSIPLRASLL